MLLSAMPEPDPTRSILRGAPNRMCAPVVEH
jgi:hypothetical protein